MSSPAASTFRPTFRLHLAALAKNTTIVENLEIRTNEMYNPKILTVIWGLSLYQGFKIIFNRFEPMNSTCYTSNNNCFPV